MDNSLDYLVNFSQPSGVSTDGVTAISFKHVFRQRDFLGTLVNLLLSFQKCQGVLFFPILQNSLPLQGPHQCRPHLSATKAASSPVRRRGSPTWAVPSGARKTESIHHHHPVGWCIEASVSILVQSQSRKSLPGGGGCIESLFSQVLQADAPLQRDTEYLKRTQILIFKGFHLKRKSPQGDLKQETYRKHPVPGAPS